MKNVFNNGVSIGTEERNFTFKNPALDRSSEKFESIECFSIENSSLKLSGKSFLNAIQIEVPSGAVTEIWEFSLTQSAVSKKVSDTKISWKSIEAEGCKINYIEGFESDARKFELWMSKAVAAVEKEFASASKSDFFNQVKNCNIYLYDTPNEKANVGKVLGEEPYYILSDKYELKIHFLTPSAMPPGQTTVTGLKKDDDYFFHILVHEYTTTALEYFNEKAGGWEFSTTAAPNWFIQGYEEYMGLNYSSDTNRDATSTAYKQLVASKANLISFEGTLPELANGADD